MQPIIWIFEDQLSHALSTWRDFPAAPVLMIESNFAFRMQKFHKKRLVFLISAMRHFRDELIAAGRTVHYYPLKNKGYRDSVSAIRHCSKTTGSRLFHTVAPSEYHTRLWLEELEKKLAIQIEIAPNQLFLTDRTEFSDWARKLKSPVMETFYRRMRLKHDVLIEADKPVGGAWNFDKLNRKPPKDSLLIPRDPTVDPDEITRAVMAEVTTRFADHPGSVEGFDYPVTCRQAETALEHFLQHRLPLFGDFEDAMVSGQSLLFHSRLSSAINAGLLSPMQCIRGAEQRYRKNKAPLNAVEGFIRQILGWREYMYGIYWAFMPEYRDRNARGETRPLPDFFWTGQTEMNCLRQTITGVINHAYNHHIQRLMIICNFATLAGLSPQAVNDWFLQMYIDSHDWVVTPNVIGMGMNADGGTCATKPYVSSAAYINRMSDYCAGCRFKPADRSGTDACPFNFLYWTFLETHRKSLEKNPRMMMVTKNLDRMESSELKKMREQKRAFLEGLISSGGY
jgi:deoxyribodipyrimidine photolyase-related protein